MGSAYKTSWIVNRPAVGDLLPSSQFLAPIMALSLARGSDREHSLTPSPHNDCLRGGNATQVTAEGILVCAWEICFCRNCWQLPCLWKSLQRKQMPRRESWGLGEESETWGGSLLPLAMSEAAGSTAPGLFSYLSKHVSCSVLRQFELGFFCLAT